MESFTFVVANFRGLSDFLLVRGDVISWMSKISVLEGKPNLL